MIAIPMVIMWAGYGLASWGWCLVRGYDVPFIAWFDPVHIFEWPPGGPSLIPDNQILPSAAAAASQGAVPPVGEGNAGPLAPAAPRPAGGRQGGGRPPPSHRPPPPRKKKG